MKLVKIIGDLRLDRLEFSEKLKSQAFHQREFCVDPYSVYHHRVNTVARLSAILSETPPEKPSHRVEEIIEWNSDGKRGDLTAGDPGKVLCTQLSGYYHTGEYVNDRIVELL